MKIKNLLMFIVVFLLVNTSVAQDLTKGGSSFGKVESNGDVRINGSVKGKFESN